MGELAENAGGGSASAAEVHAELALQREGIAQKIQSRVLCSQHLRALAMVALDTCRNSPIQHTAFEEVLVN